MGQQVKNGRHKASETQRHHHVAQLANGRIGQHALDVVLCQANRRAKESSDGPDNGHHGQH